MSLVKKRSAILLYIVVLIGLSYGAFSTAPNPGHPASQISGGLFSGNDGNFLFPDTVNVGIGTPTASYSLQVQKDVVANYQMHVGDLSSGYGINLGVIDGDTSARIQATQIGVSNNVNLSIQASGGNVGIGTDTPGQKLTVNGDFYSTNITGPGGQTRIAGSLIARYGQSINLTLGVPAWNGIYGSPDLILGTGSSENMRISSTGNVGIGTTNPNARLDVGSGDIAFNSTGSGASLRQNVYPYKGFWHYRDDGTGYGPAFMHTNSATGMTYPTMFLMSNGNGAELNVDYAISLGDMTLANMGDYPSITARTRITGDSGANSYFNTGGNVGINTTSPSYKLEVRNDDTGTTGIINPLIVLSNHKYTTPDDGSSIAFEASDGLIGAAITGRNQYSSGAIALAFSTTNNTGTYGERMRISSAGNVGIGTSIPYSALDVIRPGNANVYENGVRVNRPDSQGQYAFMGYGQSSSDAYFGSVYTGGGAGVYGMIHLRQYSSSMTPRDVLNIDGSGNVGIGTTAPIARLDIGSNNAMFLGGNTNSWGWYVNVTDFGDGSVPLMFIRRNAGSNTPMVNITQNGDLYVTRNIYYGGNLTGYGADFAEMMPAAEALEAGDVVCLNDDMKVVKCSSHRQPSVAGVVSDSPTIIGNAANDGVAVGITGIVSTKVKGPVAKFDMLTSSTVKGFAEKATKDDFGSIVGKAMEDCNNDSCEIKVLVSLG